MPVAIQSLNADSTFLLTFTPPASSAAAIQPFTILLDPWLSGSSHILHPKFALTTNKTRPHFSSLADLPDGLPDLVLVSQSKSDHCDERTLRQLPADSVATTIFAQPAAARKIRRWRHFPPETVRSLPTYNPTDPASVVRLPVVPRPRWASHSLGKGGDVARIEMLMREWADEEMRGWEAGEITLTLIPAKRDITGLHNAIGITYRPPQMQSPSLQGSELFSSYALHPPLTPTTTTSFPLSPPLSPSTWSLPTPSKHNFSPPGTAYAAYSPLSPLSLTSVGSRDGPGATLSFLYTPHGVSPNAVRPYAMWHLRPLSAFPLTVLLHPFDIVRNSRLLGGTIAAGAEHGNKLAQAMEARVWVGAHDGDKVNTGVSVRSLTVQRFDMSEIRDLVAKKATPRRERMRLFRLGAGEVAMI